MGERADGPRGFDGSRGAAGEPTNTLATIFLMLAALNASGRDRIQLAVLATPTSCTKPLRSTKQDAGAEPIEALELHRHDGRFWLLLDFLGDASRRAASPPADASCARVAGAR